MSDQTQSEGGIPLFSEYENIRSINAHFWKVGRLYFQPRVVWLAMFGQFDVYVYLANVNFVTTWLGAAICRLRGRRVVFWGHGFLDEHARLKNRMRGVFFSLADAFYSYGHRSKAIAETLGFRPENLYVGFNSLDYCRQMQFRRGSAEHADGLANEEPHRELRILCVSRLTALCNYGLLLHAMALASQEYCLETVAVFVGDGPERPKLERLGRELHLHVEFMGSIYEERVLAPIIQDADVTVMPGKIGLTAMHSLMYGTPVISHSDFDSQMPEVEAIVPGVTGALFRKGDVADLARVLAHFPSMFPDRAVTMANCCGLIDEVYNPMRQTEVLMDAASGEPAGPGNDVQLWLDAR